MINSLADINREQAVQWLQQMIRIRRFEEACIPLYGAEKIRGFLHLYNGEEAIATGVLSALNADDGVVATYREHGHALCRGIAMPAIMAELFGKLEGCCRGRGGSMHLFDAATRFYGGNAIVGAGLPVAVGLALADKLQQRPRITACFFGEGAVAEGEFHESLNLAALWQLPVLFLCENNRYAMGTALERSESEIDIHRKAESYKLRAEVVDGMDVVAVNNAAKAAVERMRKKPAPEFLELRTYRFRAHSMFDAELYRDKAEVEEWKQRCPITTFSARLKSQNMVTEADIEAIEKAVTTEIEAATAFAEAGTPEPVENLLRDVYSDTL